MKTILENIFLTLFVLTLIWSVMAGFGNYRRVRCNQVVLGKEVLSERFDSWSFFDDSATTTEAVGENVKTLRTMLEQTNTEVNNLRRLMGCYFDK